MRKRAGLFGLVAFALLVGAPPASAQSDSIGRLIELAESVCARSIVENQEVGAYRGEFGARAADLADDNLSNTNGFQVRDGALNADIVSWTVPRACTVSGFVLGGEDASAQLESHFAGKASVPGFGSWQRRYAIRVNERPLEIGYTLATRPDGVRLTIGVSAPINLQASSTSFPTPTALTADGRIALEMCREYLRAGTSMQWSPGAVWLIPHSPESNRSFGPEARVWDLNPGARPQEAVVLVELDARTCLVSFRTSVGTAAQVESELRSRAFESVRSLVRPSPEAVAVLMIAR